jgi:hypothetical protein
MKIDQGAYRRLIIKKHFQNPQFYWLIESLTMSDNSSAHINEDFCNEKNPAGFRLGFRY